MGCRSPENMKNRGSKRLKERLLTKHDVPTCLDTPSNNTVQDNYHGDSDTCTSAFGNVAIDIDIIDMALYDLYRQIDGEPHSQDHLKCRMKLMQKDNGRA